MGTYVLELKKMLVTGSYLHCSIIKLCRNIPCFHSSAVCQGHFIRYLIKDIAEYLQQSKSDDDDDTDS